jgi:hypothetical protein
LCSLYIGASDLIPSSLKQLVLSGNPICGDHDAVSLLRGRLPGVEVACEAILPSESSPFPSGKESPIPSGAFAGGAARIIDSAAVDPDGDDDRGQEGSLSGSAESEDGEGEAGPEDSKPEETEPWSSLDADELLRGIVDRKCQIQEMASKFNLEETLKVPVFVLWEV